LNEEELSIEALARLGALRFQVQRLVEAATEGLHDARGLGGAGEFIEHRHFRTGDSPRRIDWRASARRDNVMVQELRPEKRLDVAVLVDTSASMGSGNSISKLRYGWWLGLGAGYIAQRAGDGAGLHLLAGKARWQRRLRRGLAELGLWAEELETIEAEGATNLGDAVAEIGGELGSKGLLIVVSDLLEADEQFWRGLGELRQRGWHCAVVRLLAAEEVDFDYEGGIRFEPIERGEPLTIDAQAIRSAYLQELERFDEDCRRSAAQAGANILFARNDDPPVAVLRRLTREYLR
jgi:uncharacterized protein (DUF58 family)